MTGGQGFIGSHFIKKMLGRYGDRLNIVNVDNMAMPGSDGSRFCDVYERGRTPPQIKNLQAYGFRLCRQTGPTNENGQGAGNPRHRWYNRDAGELPGIYDAIETSRPKWVIHFAAQTHVDFSIDQPDRVWRNNLLSVGNTLEACRLLLLNGALPQGFRFLLVSTDEVYGPLRPRPDSHVGLALENGFKEHHRLNPRNPYAASKAAAEHLAMAYYCTYGMPVLITRGCNTWGTHQFPEKFLPMIINNALHDQPIPIYGSGLQKREWIHVEDHCQGILEVLNKGQSGEAYNIGTGNCTENIELARTVLGILGKPASLLKHVPDRPGHDPEYRVDPTKLADLDSWAPSWNILCDCQLGRLISWHASELGQAWVNWTGHDTSLRQEAPR